MSGLDANTLSRFVALAGDRLSGDWVVIGGCVLPILGVEHRVTVDIDVAGPDDMDMEQMLVLMEIVEEMGLPVATVNQAGSHFIRRIEDWREHLVVVRRGKRATIHVPDATLFLLLKVRRLTEADLLDCARMLELPERRRGPLDAPRVREAARAELERVSNDGRRERVEHLLELVGAHE